MSDRITDRAPATQRRRCSNCGWVALLLTWSLPVAAANEAPAGSQPQGSSLSSGRAVIAAGGGTSTGGTFAIDGTIGQADVDPLQPSTGGAFSITGGFWFTASSAPGTLFANGFEQP